MAAFGGTSVLSSTLQEITTTKLHELSKRRSEYEDRKTRVISALAAESHPVRRLQILSTGVKACFGVIVSSSNDNNATKDGFTSDTRPAPATAGATADYYSSGLSTQLDNLDLFVSQARYDPSVSAAMAKTWEDSLLKHLDKRSLKFQYASLYAQLVTEWLSAEKATKAGAADANDEDVGMHDGDGDDEDDFEDLALEAKREARADFEKRVFTPAEVDEPALQQYLADIFGVADIQDPAYRDQHESLEALRKSIKWHEAELSNPNQFNPHVLRWVCDGLISSGSLSDEKRQVLDDFKNQPIIMAEVADVLNMRMQSLDTWSWGADGVRMEQERMINGVYNIVMREDLLQALLLHYIGVKWSVALKRSLRTFRKTAESAWVAPFRKMDQKDRLRREYYLGGEKKSRSLQGLRDKVYRKHYYLSALKNTEGERLEHVAGEMEAQYSPTSPAFSPSSPGGPQGPNQHQQQLMQLQQVRIQAPAPSSVLNDYQSQLMMLEQQNKQRKMMAQQAQQMAQQPQQQQMMRAAPAKKRMAVGGYSAGAHFSAESDDENQDTDDEEEVEQGADVSRNMKSLSVIKQRLLRLLSTEVIINTKLYGEVTAVRSLFESWNTRLPHQTVLGILSFLGVSKTWLAFFKRFLAAPLRFDGDSADTTPRARQRGTPAARVLSEVFGETTLFCLDLGVNRATDGAQLWRLQDEFWFWSRDLATAEKAWAAAKRFEKVTGTTINTGKSGSVHINLRDTSRDTSRGSISSSLPRGDIRWGFLRLSPSTGHFEIDQVMVDKQILDLRKQLYGKRGSIIAFIQAWNTYASTFFTHNFGKPANSFGRQHVEQMLATHGRVQREVFAAQKPPMVSLTRPAATDCSSDNDSPTNMVDFLKKELALRFGVTDVPDAYLFFPTDMGGLDLRSPFISILQVHKSVLADPATSVGKFLDAEQKAYKTLKAAWEDEGGKLQPSQAHAKRARTMAMYGGPGGSTAGSYPTNEMEMDTKSGLLDQLKFLTFDEYVRYREDVAPSTATANSTDGFRGLGDVYRALLRMPAEEGGVQSVSRAVAAAIGALPPSRDAGGDGGITSSLHTMKPYWKWVVAMYGPEVVERFGGLHIVEPGLLPMGMVRMFREKRMQWDN
ncbi:POU domain transcription factor class 2 [Microdochium nivale]|nr:POU domain transcription factor class 2 [Microdochium nivale]